MRREESMANRTLLSFWPKIVDEESARAAAHGGVAGAGMVVIATTVLLVWGIVAGKPIAGVGLSALIDVGLFLFIGFGIYRMSRVAAVAGLSLYLLELWFTTKTNGASANVILPIIIILAFIGGIRGTVAYHRYRKLSALDAEPGA
jgi:hypothetical protein